ncbi:hypothetical protein BsWGS_06874 [Bradybaena similaris]
MAYLPPAGVRCLTDSKLTYLPTMSEIQNPAYTEKMLAAIKINAERGREEAVVPLKKVHKLEEYDFKPAKKYTEIFWDSSRIRPFWVGPPCYRQRNYEMREPCSPAQPDLRRLPYGLPPDSFDVKIRANWFDHWKQENYVYTGAFQQWEKKFGARYLYPVPVIPKPPRFSGNKT